MVRDALQQRMADFLDVMDDLTPGKSGDYSLRGPDHIIITPTGVRYDRIEAGMFPVLDLDGRRVNGDLEPSSEWATHRAIYRQLDAGAVVHTHSPWVTTLAVLGESPQFVHYSAALAGTEIPVVEYETYGTQRLAKRVVSAFYDTGSRACVLANHGLVCRADSLAGAFDVAEGVEFAARMTCQSRRIGQPRQLTAEEIEDVAEKFEDYGQSGTSRLIEPD